MDALGAPVYRNPPYILGPQVMLAAELADKVDWGLEIHGIEEFYKKTKGADILVGVAQGVRWLHEQGCNIINMSLGGPFDRSIAEAVKEAVAGGTFVICAAGNEGHVVGQNTVGYPARLPSTVAIASYNKAGKLSKFSSRGKEVHVAFPGEEILSTWLNGAYRRISGTSMATPFAAGLVALYLSLHAERVREGKELKTPINTNEQLIAHLREVAVDRGPIGRDEGWGWGVVDTEKFFATQGNGNGDPPAPVEPTPPSDVLTLFGLLELRQITHEGKEGLFISPSF